jgi:hypothetical protein
MPGGSTATRGNELFSQVIYITVTPPASVVTATQTTQNVTVSGVQVGDIMSYNLTTAGTNYNALLLLESMYVSAANTILMSWSSTGATIAGAGPQTILCEVTRPENVVDGGVTVLPSTIF